MDWLLSAIGGDQNVLVVLAPIVGALFTGVAIGWVLWGDGASEAPAKSTQPDGAIEIDKPTRERVQRLEEEVREARRLLAATASRDEDFAQDLSTLDAAVKRAAGRIALIARGAKS